MADKPDLRELHERIDASNEEMARYRARLGARLDTVSPATTPMRWFAAAAVPIAAAIIVWIAFAPSDPRLEQEHLGELQTLVSRTETGTLDEITRKAVAGKSERARYNANMLVCLTSPDGTALREAARGAVTDPRAEFRAWYLEYLLDYADGYQLDPERIDAQMDTETDSTCLKLYARLLDMAEAGAASRA